MAYAESNPLDWTLGDRIYKATRIAGLDRTDVADALRERGLVVSRQRVSKWINDESEPSTSELVALAEIVEQEREWLLGFRWNPDEAADNDCLLAVAE